MVVFLNKVHLVGDETLTTLKFVVISFSLESTLWRAGSILDPLSSVLGVTSLVNTGGADYRVVGQKQRLKLFPRISCIMDVSVMNSFPIHVSPPHSIPLHTLWSWISTWSVVSSLH